MAIVAFEAVPLEAIVMCGMHNGHLEILDVAAAGATCLSLLYCCGSRNRQDVFCRRHGRWHPVGILSARLGYPSGLLAADEAERYARGLAHRQRDFLVELGGSFALCFGDDPEVCWRGFIAFRAWLIYRGLIPDLSI